VAPRLLAPSLFSLIIPLSDVFAGLDPTRKIRQIKQRVVYNADAARKRDCSPDAQLRYVIASCVSVEPITTSRLHRFRLMPRRHQNARGLFGQTPAPDERSVVLVLSPAPLPPSPARLINVTRHRLDDRFPSLQNIDARLPWTCGPKSSSSRLSLAHFLSSRSDGRFFLRTPTFLTAFSHRA